MRGRSGLLVAVVLYAVALGARLVAAAQVSLPPTQVSAYYLDVAGNLAAGRGLVGDAIWSYATPPLALPQPAFALWMPLATFVAAIPRWLGASPLGGPQLAFALLGALLAPLTWFVAREAATRNRLTGRRPAAVGIGSGLVAGLLGPGLLAAMGPDSWTPFTVAAVCACLLIPRAIRNADREASPNLLPGLLLGLALGLAYLSRQEAAEFGLAYLVLLVPAVRARRPAQRPGWLGRALGPTVVAGLVVVLPWLGRNLLTFGSVGGQALENLVFTRNEDVFAYMVRPSLATFLAQGPGTILGHVAAGLWAQLTIDLLLTAAPVGLVGLIAAVFLARTPALREPTALRALLIGGGLIFLVTGMLFPVATLWGTFRHAAGPLLIGLTVSAALGVDAFLARVGRWRAWDKDNAWLATLVLLVTVIPVAAIEVRSTAGAARAVEVRLDAAARVLQALPVPAGTPIVSDWPIWLSSRLGRTALVLPDERPADVLALGRRFDARYVVVLSPDADGGGGTDRPGLPNLDGAACFTRLPLPADAGPGSRLYRIEAATTCTP